MNELKVFEGSEVEIIEENGVILFEIYSTGMALGHVKKGANGNNYPRKERIEENLRSAEIEPCCIDDKKYVTKKDLFIWISVTSCENKRKFIEWLEENKFIEWDKVVIVKRKELMFLDELSIVLDEMNIEYIFQHNILSYRVDFFLPKLNIAIEYDENEHRYYSYEDHEGRENNIREEINCDFIRLTNKDSNLKNIGIVVNFILNKLVDKQ